VRVDAEENPNRQGIEICRNVPADQAISSLSFCFFPLVQAGASVKKRESDKWKKPGIDFQKATCSHP